MKPALKYFLNSIALKSTASATLIFSLAAVAVAVATTTTHATPQMKTAEVPIQCVITTTDNYDKNLEFSKKMKQSVVMTLMVCESDLMGKIAEIPKALARLSSGKIVNCKRKFAKSLTEKFGKVITAEQLKEIFPNIKETSVELQNQIEKIKSKLSPSYLAQELFSEKLIDVKFKFNESSEMKSVGTHHFSNMENSFRLVRVDENGLKIEKKEGDEFIQFNPNYHRLIEIDGVRYRESSFNRGSSFKMGNLQHWESAKALVGDGVRTFGSDNGVIGTSGGNHFLDRSKKEEVRVRLLVVQKSNGQFVPVAQILKGFKTDNEFGLREEKSGPEFAQLLGQFIIPMDQDLDIDIKKFKLNSSVDKTREKYSKKRLWVHCSARSEDKK